MSPVVQNSPSEDRHLVEWCAHGVPKTPTNPQGVVGIIAGTIDYKHQPPVQMLLEQFGTPNVPTRSRTKSSVQCRGRFQVRADCPRPGGPQLAGGRFVNTQPAEAPTPPASNSQAPKPGDLVLVVPIRCSYVRLISSAANRCQEVFLCIPLVMQCMSLSDG